MTDRDALALLRELTAMVRAECPSLLNEDSGGDARLSLAIDDALSTSPPADLVALVAKMQNAEAESEQAALRGDMAASIKAAERWDAACDDLLAYPLPAPDRSDR